MMLTKQNSDYFEIGEAKFFRRAFLSYLDLGLSHNESFIAAMKDMADVYSQLN